MEEPNMSCTKGSHAKKKKKWLGMGSDGYINFQLKDGSIHMEDPPLEQHDRTPYWFLLSSKRDADVGPNNKFIFQLHLS